MLGLLIFKVLISFSQSWGGLCRLRAGAQGLKSLAWQPDAGEGESYMKRDPRDPGRWVIFGEEGGEIRFAGPDSCGRLLASQQLCSFCPESSGGWQIACGRQQLFLRASAAGWRLAWQRGGRAPTELFQIVARRGGRELRVEALSPLQDYPRAALLPALLLAASGACPAAN